MTELLFESTMDNVSGLEVKGYSDPVKMERTMEIWVKRGDEEYLYKFTGPGVDKFEADADGRCWIENEKLQQENTLNKETADTWSKECHSLYTKIDKLQEENEKLKEELYSLKQEKTYSTAMVDDCLKLSKEIEKLTFEKEMIKKGNEKFKKGNERLRNENQKLKKDLQEIQEAFPMTANKILYGEGELKVENEDTDRVEKVLVNVDRFDSLLKDNKKLREQNKMLSEGNKDLREGLDKVSNRAEELRKQINESNGLQYPITRERVLEQAKECVCGHREQDYGTPESNFQLIADLWNGYLGFMDHPQDQIRATDVAMLMALMKIARIRNGGGSGDSFVDLAGYAACGGEIWDGERH